MFHPSGSVFPGKCQLCILFSSAIPKATALVNMGCESHKGETLRHALQKLRANDDLPLRKCYVGVILVHLITHFANTKSNILYTSQIPTFQKMLTRERTFSSAIPKATALVNMGCE